MMNQKSPKNILESTSSSPNKIRSSGLENGNSSTDKIGTTKIKKQRSDFKLGKILGVGSYSTVVHATDIITRMEYAIKIIEKRLILREKKSHQVAREKEILTKITKHPFFVKLHYTFQDSEKLYFVLKLARHGELLPYINKLGSFDEECSRFYSAEIIVALEYLHSMDIIHRDLKPENILLGEDFHILLTDFGTAKILNEASPKANSFVGTAQYVSPEILTSKAVTKSCDLWALGCIIYHFISGLQPFRGSNEYLTFQLIVQLEYDFPDGFSEIPKDLVTRLLKINPEERLGNDNFDNLKKHPFYKGIDWDRLPTTAPPKLLPYLPGENLHSDYVCSCSSSDEEYCDNIKLAHSGHSYTLADLYKTKGHERKKSEAFVGTDMDIEHSMRLLEQQKLSNVYHELVKCRLILKQGGVEKRKGLFSRKRMLILTVGPRLFLIDPITKTVKDEIPFTKALRPEAKTFKIFFVHTPKRTYYFEDLESSAEQWCDQIEHSRQLAFG